MTVKGAWHNMSHFWIGGKSEYEKVLDEEYWQRIAVLKRQLSSARIPGEREECRQWLTALRAEYKAKKRAIRQSLFHVPKS